MYVLSFRLLFVVRELMIRGDYTLCAGLYNYPKSVLILQGARNEVVLAYKIAKRSSSSIDYFKMR